ncbi:MAG: ABC transporter ATP-binding protein [Thermoanaerobaculia bacterium]
MELLKVKNLYFSFPENKFTLKDISFSCQRGKILGFAGPNGAGKSTLIKLLSGLEKFERGEIYLKDKKIFSLRPLERARILRWVGQIEERKIPFKVWDYLIFGTFPHTSFFGKISKKEIGRAEELLEVFSLSGKRERYVEELSGGERKLLQICFALISEPEILLLDEPFAHLDPLHIKTLFSLIKKEKERGVSFIISSHEYHILNFISDYLLLLSDGQMVCCDEKSNIPPSLWEKTFKVPFKKISDENSLIPDIF